MKNTFLILTILLSFGVQAQDKTTSWEIQVSTDSLLMGNQLKVTFVLQNASGRNFRPPNFDGFNVMMGPNSSTSMSIVNGNMSQEAKYTYVIEPIETGNYFLEAASIEVDNEYIETTPLEIIVFPNPDGIVQKQENQNDPLRWDHLPWDPPEKKKKKGKKKKKIYKI